MITTRLISAPSRILKRFTQTLTYAMDPVQERSMNEMCILTNEDDKYIGYATKRDCHRIKKNRDLPLHRAFSLLLFNSKDEILLQKRSSTKVTFPSFVSNTCCSHPLYDIASEREETDALGVKLAAQRRLNIELGIPAEEANVNCMHYLTRLHYKFYGDGEWGEHELDYILIMHRDVSLNPNPDEVSDLYFVPKDNLKSYLDGLNAPLSPWFNYLIESNMLNKWWDNLHRLNDITDHNTIHRVSTI